MVCILILEDIKLKAIEEIGITKEKFHEIYEENAGFNFNFNKNHPSYDCDECYTNFLAEGSKNLIKEHKDLIKGII